MIPDDYTPIGNAPLCPARSASKIAGAKRHVALAFGSPLFPVAVWPNPGVSEPQDFDVAKTTGEADAASRSWRRGSERRLSNWGSTLPGFPF